MGGGLPEGTPEGLTLAGEEVNGSIQHGFILYGCPVGSPEYVRHQLQKIAERIVAFGRQTADLLSCERQSLWLAAAPSPVGSTSGCSSATLLMWLQWRGGWTMSCGRSWRQPSASPSPGRLAAESGTVCCQSQWRGERAGSSRNGSSNTQSGWEASG